MIMSKYEETGETRMDLRLAELELVNYSAKLVRFAYLSCSIYEDFQISVTVSGLALLEISSSYSRYSIEFTVQIWLAISRSNSDFAFMLKFAQYGQDKSQFHPRTLKEK